MELNNIQIMSKQPYPEIKDAIPNERTVLILQDLLASNKGEMTAITQYFYQSIVAESVDESISNLLEEISVVEMRHMEELMSAIKAFGGDPRYNNSKGMPFNTNYVKYFTRLKDMLDANIVGEQQAINDYTRAQSLVQNQSLKDLFARIIEDEKSHLNTFKTLRNSVTFLSI